MFTAVRVSVRSRPVRFQVARPVQHLVPQSRSYAIACEDKGTLTAEMIEAKIRSQIDVRHIAIEDARGDGSFFHVSVASPAFTGLNKLKQHQLMNRLLADEIKLVHGVTFRTLAIE